MPFADLLAVALQELTRHKLRSGLTLLGIIIGVTTVVSVVSVISGLNDYVATKVIALNPDVLIFTKYGIIRGRNEWLLARKRKELTMRDMELVVRACQSCGAVGARGDSSATVSSGKRRLVGVQIQGFTANVDEMMSVDLEAGRLFNDVEVWRSAAVAVIGADLKDELFPTVDPIGRTIEIRGFPLKVIGLQTRLGKILGQNRDNVVLLPITFLQKTLTASDGISIAVKPRAGMADLDRTQDEVRTILRSARRTGFRADDPFGIVGAEALQSLWRSISAGAFALMFLISGISLVAGAIVVANTMFVAVVERTREIGTRMAVGARRRDIRRQFLLESALLSAVGGAVGVVLGALAALAVSSIFPATVRPSFIVLGVGVATVAGVIAGLAPAAAAARLPPVEALRQE